METFHLDGDGLDEPFAADECSTSSSYSKLTSYSRRRGDNPCVISSRPAVIVVVLLLIITCVSTVVTLTYVVSEMKDMRGQLTALSLSAPADDEASSDAIQAMTSQRNRSTGRGKAHSSISTYMNQTLSDNQELLLLSAEIRDLLQTVNHTTQLIIQTNTDVRANGDNLQLLKSTAQTLRKSLSNQTAGLKSLTQQMTNGQSEISDFFSRMQSKLTVGTDVLQQTFLTGTQNVTESTKQKVDASVSVLRNDITQVRNQIRSSSASNLQQYNSKIDDFKSELGVMFEQVVENMTESMMQAGQGYTLPDLSPTTTTAPSCPSNYVLKPDTSTCIRNAGSGYNWTSAKSRCEAEGDNLVVFTTQTSVDWIKDYVKDRAPSSWRRNCHWIGLRHNSTGWYWRGRETSHLPNSSPLWDQGEPDESFSSSCGCICMQQSSYTKLHDCTCGQTQLLSLCERPAQ